MGLVVRKCGQCSRREVVKGKQGRHGHEPQQPGGPRIKSVILDTAGCLSLLVGLSALRVQWINLQADFQQLLHGRTLAGLDRKRNRAIFSVRRSALAGLGSASYASQRSNRSK